MDIYFMKEVTMGLFKRIWTTRHALAARIFGFKLDPKYEVYEHPLVGDEWAAIDKDRNVLDHAPTITELVKKLKKKNLDDKLYCFTPLSKV
jgi:hypothetical protein